VARKQRIGVANVCEGVLHHSRLDYPSRVTLYFFAFLEQSSGSCLTASRLGYFSVSIRDLISSRATGFWIC